jgi:C6 transcription factor Pro1
MDAGPKEKEMVAKIRHTVKEASSQKKRIAMRKRQGQLPSPEEETTSFEPRLTDSFSSPGTIPRRFSLEPTEPSRDVPLLIDGTPPGLTPKDAATYVAQNESVLLMHYLDNVFPCQFRFYQPSLEDGGRGWLLSLLMQTKPLYHAACSLAAYHRQMMYCLTGGMIQPCFTRQALQLHHGIAITELRKYLELLVQDDHERTLEEEVQLLCSIVLFISTEVSSLKIVSDLCLTSIQAFINSTESWKIHLAAAVAVFPNIQRQLSLGGLTDLSMPNLRAALCFFASVARWYDIISCATTGSKPFDLTYPNIEGHTHFDKVMGCENWIIFAIKDIAALNHWKNSLKAAGQLSVRELVSRGNEIEARLNKGLADLRATQQLQALNFARKGIVLEHDQSYLNSCVTRVYCCAGLVYLNVVVSGAHPNLPEIRNSVAQAIEAFKALPYQDLVNSLIWPLCITGCMSLERDEDFFREIARSADPTDSNFGASKARIIFEECWRLRKLDPDSGKVDWRTAMNSLDFNILLK